MMKLLRLPAQSAFLRTRVRTSTCLSSGTCKAYTPQSTTHAMAAIVARTQPYHSVKCSLRPATCSPFSQIWHLIPLWAQPSNWPSSMNHTWCSGSSVPTSTSSWTKTQPRSNTDSSSASRLTSIKMRSVWMFRIMLSHWWPCTPILTLVTLSASNQGSS